MEVGVRDWWWYVHGDNGRLVAGNLLDQAKVLCGIKLLRKGFFVVFGEWK